ncbi:hypothetical protein KL933_000960 [Ogataea haglerorum]|uniref:Methyltransferase domain-containing protein n=1 Tax=Ogataea haglerorum TaxID=1937702 RepID=A0AAN6D8S8_9ASCO|nr:uncharacterized protein KL911_001618 [Ogataea haglerorum]KAG7698014.1 hypothetical protein KL915_001731 [Ogataea haglerorum]KAG7699692.1 hypothetical protein KL951_001409 [Ogataea haglerorum]KAG7708236.1 hypothetical protein KL914_001962 [Ogataea haglerorum]KAG7710737.1 hypothetical protein KL950_001650 [Ogataea haglerorum]KAG7729880.1 hypothetical protein KL933_000960 [Ogataea haglerorum]
MYDRQDFIAVPPLSSSLTLGMSPAKTAVTVPFAHKTASFGVSNVLDLGSGKGYLARILANGFGLKVCCVDHNKDRIKSSLRIHSLIQQEQVLQTSLGPSGNLHAVAAPIEEWENFIDEATSFFRRKTRLGEKELDVAVVGLQLCGDMVYRVIDLVSGCNRAGIRLCAFLVSPCCLHKVVSLRSKAFRASEVCVENIYKDIQEYLVERGFRNVHLGYLNIGYYYIEATR